MKVSRQRKVDKSVHKHVFSSLLNNSVLSICYMHCNTVVQNHSKIHGLWMLAILSPWFLLILGNR